MMKQNSLPVILITGHWLGGWAWDAVVETLSRDGISSVALTLPGLDSPDTPRAGIRLSDHVKALTDVIRAQTDPVVLVAHSGAGVLATAVLDQIPSLVRRVVYVDSGPVVDGTIAHPDLDPDTGEVPLPGWEELEAGGASLTGLSEETLQHFRARAVPHPAGPLVEPLMVRNSARNDVPATIVCCSLPSATVRQMTMPSGFFAALGDLTDAHYIDLPTGHWPMWSAPDALAHIIAQAMSGVQPMGGMTNHTKLVG